MSKQNKVLEALLNVRKRIETEVVTFKRSDKEYEIEGYETIGIDGILLDATNEAIREGERKLKVKEVKPISRKHGSRKRK